MNTEKIQELIDGSDMSPIQKNISKGFLARAKEREESIRGVRNLVEKVSGNKNVSEIIFSNDDVIIYTVSGSDNWEIKYPFRSIYKLTSGTWLRNSTVSPTFDLAFLNYLEKKHLGLNSQFVDFACKMLEIKIEE